MTRAVVNVATGEYVRGQKRLRLHVGDLLECWANIMPPSCPQHSEVPYAFKAYALDTVRRRGVDLALWCDASIKPIRSLEPLWSLIEQQGYWFSANWWPNGEWCSDAALPLLGITRDESMTHMHVAATAFGLNLRSEIGNTFLDDYLRLAKNGSFCGPWRNDHGQASSDPRVRGHRHDQTAASVICWRLGMTLTQPPAWFAYKGSETEKTVLLVERI